MSIANAVANSSNQVILKSFAQIVKTNLPNNRWLSVRNYYLKETKDKVNDIPTPPAKPKPLAEYISASVLLHCYDGWNYLSRASESLLNGDVSSAIHFVYYSELRSVMSIMAFDGIGIFDKRHIWFDANHSANHTAGHITTHTAAKDCITEWSKSATKKDVVFDLVRVNNHSLGEWIAATQFSLKSSYSSAIVKEWFDRWSMDIRLKEDQTLRNEMSYRPHFEYSKVNIKELVDSLNSIWTALEPVGSSRFNDLDRHLFRIAIEKVYSKWKGRSATGQDFENFVTRMFDTIGESKLGLYDFVLRRSEPNDHYILTEARKDVGKAKRRINLISPLPMFCRAILLSRISTGLSSKLIKHAPASQEALRYWWEGLCKMTGIMKSTDGGEDATQLYADITECINEIAKAEVGDWDSVASAASNQSQNIQKIKQFQRACFWGAGF
ncbi:MAG TPA: hypothetical protein VFE50_03935 [Cyclobacteriaceae bacterium]|nr:hypothetical protein [Cyclobacteriaceae bacterium]